MSVATARVDLALALEERRYRQSRRKLDTLFPDTGPLRRALYPKQTAFFAAGAQYRTRCFMAAHRIGKTQGKAYETALHLTGQYPAWWAGRRFAHPVRWWAAGKTGKTTRDILQLELLGEVGQFGTGTIPGEALVDTKPKAGLPDAVEIIRVQHATDGVRDGVSTLVLKSYDQGRVAFEGTAQHGIDLDEEPPLDINAQCLLRTMTTGGLVALTFTPLLGMSETVLHYLPNGEVPPDGPLTDAAYFVNASWDDVPHLSQAVKAELLAALPPYLRDAASRGLPLLSAGAIYPVPDDAWLVDDFPIPPHWKQAYGLDVGWQRTAAVWGAYDGETDCWTLWKEHYVAETQPTLHAAAIRAPGAWIPGCIDPAAQGRSQVDGEALLDLYTDLGLHLEPADNAVEAGLYQVWERLSTGRLKVCRSLSNWRKEQKLYRRDDRGHITKKDDHLMDATRYLIMSGRAIAKPVPVAKPPREARPGGGRGSWMS
jgi:phage terminase large subunit-like protein